MVSKWIAALGLGCFAVAGQAQTYLHGNPDLLVPKSSIPQPGKMHTHYIIYNGPRSSLASSALHGPASFFGGPDGFHPADIQAAYKMSATGGTGAIAIVDANDNPTILADFNTFSSTFGLPTESSTNSTASSNKVFQVVYASGSQPTADAGWGGEIALDVEWAHAMAPKAKIYLVEAASASGTDLYNAEIVAKQLVGVKECSNSWGGGEYSTEASDDTTFEQNGVVFFASSGDSPSERSYPAESANVVGVGGTSLYMSGSVVTSETAWSDAGGGPSAVVSRPSYQSVVSSIVGTVRGAPDIAAIADPYTGVAVFSTFAAGGWFVVGGTSVACPVCAGIANNRGQYSASSAAELTRLYAQAYPGGTYGSSLYRDITSGSTGTYSAMKGFDFITGVGCPVGPYQVVVTQPTYPSSVSVYNGHYVSGNLASLDSADSNTYNVSSTPVSGVGESSAISVGFSGLPASSGSTSVTMAVTNTAPVGSTTQVFAYNYVAGTWDVVNAFAGTGASSTSTFTVSNLSKYESNGNQMQFILRTFTSQRQLAVVFTVKTDAVVLQPN